MTHSDSLDQLAVALASAQAEIEGAAKRGTNPHFRAKYADLQSVWEAVRAPLTKHGLSVIQAPSAEGQRVSVDTMLLHASGQWIRGVLTVTAKDEGPQAAGSCITYLRRYALQSFAGVAPEDDDGERAEGRDAHARLVTSAPKRVPLPPGTVQIVRVQPRAAKNVEWADVTFVTDYGEEQTLPTEADPKGSSAALFEQLAQEACPVVLTTKVTPRSKKTVIDKAVRYVDWLRQQATAVESGAETVAYVPDENAALDAEIAAKEQAF